MHVAVFNGSPRRNGNTARLCKLFCETLAAEDISSEIIQVGGVKVHGCLECNHCRRTGEEVCIQKDDPFNEWFEKCVLLTGSFWRLLYSWVMSRRR